MARIETRFRYFYIDSLEALFVFAVMAVLAGIIFGELRQRFIELPALLALVPPLLNTGGNIIATFSSRLATLLNAGKIETSLSGISSKEVFLNIVAAFIQSLIMAIVLGFAVHFILTLFGRPSLGLLQNTAIAVFALLLLTFSLSSIMALIVILGAKFGLDPDTVAGPFATGIVDLSAIVFLYVAAGLLTG